MHPRARTEPGLAFNERTSAFLLDWLILGGAAFLAAGGGAPGFGALVVVSLINQGIATGLTGYSLGKAIMGVKAAKLDSSGTPGIVAGLIRWVLLWVDLIVFGLIGLIVSGRSPRRQRVGDIVAKTWVVGVPPARRVRAISAVVFLVLCLALVFVASTAAGWAVTGVFVPVTVGAWVIVAGIGRRLAPWPWLVGLGVSIVPACYMASVKLCDKIAGTCISGAELRTSQQAIISVIAFALAIGVLLVPRSRMRDAAFIALVLFGQVWLTIKLINSHERAEYVMVIALIVLQLSGEMLARLHAARERAADRTPAVAA
jgi:uncharacterized RDD family membrane protein YckC